MKTLLPIVASLLIGCTGMPDVKVEGVDNLVTTEHIMNPLEVAYTCGEKMGMGPFWILATPLETWTCDIYYSELAAVVDTDLMAHERLHCKGYWHDENLQNYYNNWKALHKS
jgi:hypothetical protein